MLTVVPGDGSGHESGKAASQSLIDEIVREGARRMLAEALQAEVDAYIARFADERGENDRRLMVRNGYHQSREILTSAGAVEVTVPLGRWHPREHPAGGAQAVPAGDDRRTR